MRNARWLLPGALVLAVAAAGQARAEKLIGQQKLLAERAARLDAMRKLAEQICGLEIISATKVRDFVTEDDKIRGELNTFIKGAREVDVRQTDIGTVEVDMEVTLKQVIRKLIEVHKAYYRGGKITASDFEKIIERVKRKVIRVTGQGVPRPTDPVADYISYAEVYPTKVFHKKIPDIWRQYGPQAILMAKRAAELDAYRRLAERVKGLYITSTTKVRDFVTEDDKINTEFNHFIKGVRFGEPEYADDLTCRIEARLTLRQIIKKLIEIHKTYYHGDKLRASDFEKIKTEVKYKEIVEYGQGTIDTNRYKPPPAAKKTIIRKKTTRTEKPAAEESEADD